MSVFEKTTPAAPTSINILIKMQIHTFGHCLIERYRYVELNLDNYANNRLESVDRYAPFL